MALGLKFWKKGGTSGGKPPALKLSGPKDLPQKIGMDLVVKKKKDPDWVWALKVVMKTQEENNAVSDFRIFSPSQADEIGIRVLNYSTLDAHSELVLFHGWINKKSGDLHCEET